MDDLMMVSNNLKSDIIYGRSPNVYLCPYSSTSRANFTTTVSGPKSLTEQKVLKDRVSMVCNKCGMKCLN